MSPNEIRIAALKAGLKFETQPVYVIKDSKGKRLFQTQSERRLSQWWHDHKEKS
jgi:hypothetical protein